MGSLLVFALGGAVGVAFAEVFDSRLSPSEVADAARRALAKLSGSADDSGDTPDATDTPHADHECGEPDLGSGDLGSGDLGSGEATCAGGASQDELDSWSPPESDV